MRLLPLALALLPGCYLLSPEDLAARLADDSAAPDDTGLDTDTGDTDSGDTDSGDTDTGVPCPDVDGDGATDAACGGRDCDDADPTIAPDAVDVCNGVDDDCDGDVDGRFSVPTKYASIGGAVAAAGPGDVICVAAGTYFERIELSEGEIVEGAGAEATIIDGGGIGPVVRVSIDGGTLRNLTITGGRADVGAGLYATGSEVTLEDVVLRDNTCYATTCAGVGAWIAGVSSLTDVVISGNTATVAPGATGDYGEARGVGVYATEAYGVWMGVTVSENVADGNGGSDVILVGVGAYLGDSALDVSDFTATGNLASAVDARGTAACDGAGLALERDYSFVTDARIVGNALAASPTTGFSGGGGAFVYQSATEFTRVDARANTVDGAEAYGGGVFVYGGTPSFRNLRVLASTTSGRTSASGAFAIDGSATTVVENADLVGNITESVLSAQGGAFYVSTGSTLTLRNAALLLNEMSGVPANGGAVYGATSAVVSFFYDDFYRNTSPAFTGVDDPTAVDADGNFSADPSYTNIDGDPETWDLALLPESPLIDAGDRSRRDPDGSTSDIGSLGGAGGGAW